MNYCRFLVGMKLRTAFLTAATLLVSMTCTAQLSGTYTIDPAGAPFDPGGIPYPNFATFQEAVDTLHSQGVNGPVEINVADGTYNEKIQINSISGTSAANRVTFQSQSLDSTKVILRYENTTSTNIWTLRLNYTSYVTISKMRIQGDGSYYGRVININGTAHHNIIENCQLMVPGVTSGDSEIIWSGNDETDNITIRNNLFLNGSRGIDMEGIGTGQLGTGLQIYGNTFIDQGIYGVLVDVYDAPKIYNNSFDLTGGIGISVEFCFNDTEVRNNIIKMDKTIGININRCKGNALFKCLIANNFISMRGQGDAGIKSYISEHVNIYHNSVLNTSTNVQDHICAYWLDDYSPTGYSSDIDLRNNIFANTGGGPAVLIESHWAVISDNNNFYATGDKLAVWNGDQPDLQSLQTATGNDANSVSVNPRFLGTDDLHSDSYWLNGAGDATVGITTDIDGDTRMSPPDIGADEFDPITPLSGTYTIGGTDPNYATIKGAMDDLQAIGVIGPTTFEIRDGNYVEYIGTIREIPGASATDSIVLTSETSNNKNVTISYPTDNTYQNMFYLDGVDHFTIIDLTIKATGADVGRPLFIKGNIENLNLINNNFSLIHSADWAVVAIDPETSDDVVIKDNIFSGGGRCLNFIGNDVDYATNTLIEGNDFSGSTVHGLKLSYQISPRIIKNTITNTESAVENFAAMHLTYCKQAMEIIGNSITCTKAKSGIYLSNCIAVDPYMALISNNMIQAGDQTHTYGFWVRYSERQNIYHNSIHITSTDTSNGSGIFINEDNAEINIVNNILANTGGGYALFVEDPTDITLSDYNALYTIGDSLASWGGTAYPNVSLLNTASGMDGHSISDEPLFESVTDLHTNQLAYEKAGIALAAVLYDFDGNPRDPVNPDIGATEFYCETPDFNVWVSEACYGDTIIFIDSSSNITEGAQYGWDFDGDYSPDYNSTTPRETVMHYFESPGSYTVNFIVSQIGDCDDFEPVAVEVGAPPAIEISTEDSYCGNNDGSASVNVTDGSGTYSYYWSTGSTEATITDLGLGTYTVAVSDSTGCTASGEAIIKEEMVVDVTQLKGSSCGKSDGIAEVSVSGGTEPYEYVWTNGDTTVVDSTLSPGLHYVNVIDANECSVRGSIVVGNDGSGPQITALNTVNNDCYGDMNGSIDISITGGSPPYEVLWSTGARTEDINDLKAGIYDVTVLDNDSCPTSASYPISQPPMITIGSVVEEASCAGNDGRAAVLVSGGLAPYSYEWSNEEHKPLAENLIAGIYSVSVTDANDCEATEVIIVNSVGGPVINLSSLTGVSCSDTASGSISVTPSGGTPLYDWLWSPGGETTTSISGLTIGTYDVKITDAAECTGFNSFDIAREQPAVNPICLVTVDTVTGKNVIVWEKTVTTDVSHYNLYRESSVAGDYTLIASVGIDEESLYVDSVADPNIRSWRYRLSVMDICGNESDLSEPHKTMHLTMNVGIDGSVNLIWDHYEGFSVSTYKIYRYSTVEGWKNIQNMPSNLTSYTDKDPPKDAQTYYIEVPHPVGCTSHDKKASTLNSSKSNRKNKKKSSGVEPSGMKDKLSAQYLQIYPNPGSGLFNLKLELGRLDNVSVSVFDLTGKTVMSSTYENVHYTLDTQIDLSKFRAGIYQVSIRTSRDVLNTILIKK